VVQREWPLRPQRQHTDDFTLVEHDGIGVLGMERVRQPLLRIGRVLWNLLHKRSVVETVNRLKLPLLVGELPA
jgi:hypothetical protein